MSYENINSCTIRGADVEITSYTSGDAKWRFNHVPVTAGHAYSYADKYISNITSNLVAEFRMSDGSFTHIWLKDVDPASDWTTSNASIVAPVGSVSMSLFHLIRDVGKLSIDNAELHDNGAPANLIPNGSLEISGPSGWTKNLWGDNTTVFTYPSPGFGDCGETPPPPPPPPAPADDALAFDGVDDYVDIGFWDIEEETFTIEVLFKADSFTSSPHFISKTFDFSDPSGYHWALGLTSSGQIQFLLKTDDVLDSLTGGTVAEGETVHAAIVYDGSEMRIYKNGIEIASMPKLGVIERSLAPVWIASAPNTPGAKSFDGIIDDMRVWNVVRSDADILENVDQELIGSQIGLIKYWKFNEGFVILPDGRTYTLSSESERTGSKLETKITREEVKIGSPLSSPDELPVYQFTPEGNLELKKHLR